MPPDLISRRALSFGLAALYSGLACPTRASTASLVTVKESSSDGAGLTRIAEAIHQEPGTGTRVVFDHRGFPQGKGEHLASGWHTHYWEPLAKYLARN